MKLLLICSSLWWTDGFREIFSYRVKIVIKSVCQVDIIKIISGILHDSRVRKHDSGVRKNSSFMTPAEDLTFHFGFLRYLIYLFSNVTVQYYRKVICNLWQNYTWVKTSIVDICDDIDDRLTGFCFSCVKDAHNVVDVQPSRGQAQGT